MRCGPQTNSLPFRGAGKNPERRHRTNRCCTLKVPTLYATVEVTVPPGTQPGGGAAPARKGLPLFGARGRGDIDLRIEVKIPEQLTAEERARYEKLRGMGPSHRWGRRKEK